MDKSPLLEHEVKLPVKSAPSLADCSGVAEAADGSVDLGQVAPWDDGWRLVVDADFEAGGAPVDKSNLAVLLHQPDCRVDVLWYDISPVQETDGHVFSLGWITFDHGVLFKEAGLCDVIN